MLNSIYFKRCLINLATVMLLMLLTVPSYIAGASGGEPVAVIVKVLPNGLYYNESVGEALENDEGVYYTLEDALEASTSGKTVVLIKESYTLSRDVIVPNGVMLLLPCGDDYRAYENNSYNPNGTEKNGNVGISSVSEVFSELNIPKDVTLTVNGSVLVNAVTGRPAAGHYDQDINGGYALVNLDGDIIVNTGGKFDVCGLVKGGGQVTALSGAAVLDLYVVRNWRGGSQAYDVTLGHNVYPMNEIDCHNIQTTLRINHGASYTGTVKMYASASYYYTRFPQIDRYNGLIRLATNAYAIKTYDATADGGKGRSTIKLYGGATASRSTLNIVMLDLSTGGYLYPVNGNLTFMLYDGDYYVDESFKFLTGVRLYVGGSASLTFNAGKKVVFYDEFIDVDNTSTTEYPLRDPALLNLAAGAKLAVNGEFAGRISSSATDGVAQVTFSNNAILGATTLEANGYNNGVRSLSFEALLLRILGETDGYTPEAGKTYFYANGWSGGGIPSGSGECTLEGKVRLQGRSNHSGAKVELYSNDENYNAFTETDGSFSLSGINTGFYTLRITCDAYLGYQQSDVQVSPGSAVNISEIYLSSGDVNNDGKVDITDLNILLGNYQRSGLGDVNDDGKVDITDLNILLGNYQKSVAFN